jgi:hypothetical protein
MWRQKHGRVFDPLFLSVLNHLMAAIGATCTLFILSVPTFDMFVFTIVDQKVRTAEFFGILAAAMGLGLISLVFGLGFTSGSQDFYLHLIDARIYMGLSFQDVATLSCEGLRHHAQECLKKSGRDLLAAEQWLPSYHPEREKLRTEFENRYATFLDLGVIEDVGYGPFIPQKTVPM